MPALGPWPKAAHSVSFPRGSGQGRNRVEPSCHQVYCLLCSWFTGSDACFAEGGWWPWASYRGSPWPWFGPNAAPQRQAIQAPCPREWYEPPYLIAPFPCIFPERFLPISMGGGGRWEERAALFQFVYCSKASVTLLCCAGKLGISYS